MRRRSVREKSLSAVARSTIGLIQRLSLEVTVWIMPVNVLSALDVKSLSAARHPSDSALSPASLVKNAFIPGIVMVRYISPNEKGRSGLAAIHAALPKKDRKNVGEGKRVSVRVKHGG